MGRAPASSTPTDDVTSALVNAEIDGEQLTPDELASFFILLVVAGNETTRNAISWGLHLLTENPDQRAAWLADLAGVTPTAVEEIVRWASPVIFMRRTLSEPAVLGGTELPADAKVGLFYWAANRDPRYFTDPDRFDVRRSPNPHVGFGGPGPHFCLGAHLARREIAVMFRELLTPGAGHRTPPASRGGCGRCSSTASSTCRWRSPHGVGEPIGAPRPGERVPRSVTPGGRPGGTASTMGLCRHQED